MIELPEAITIAEQLDRSLRGKVVAQVLRGNTPHKFAFYNHEPDEYETMLLGTTAAGSGAIANIIQTQFDPDRTLHLGGGGERIFLHSSAASLPKKHQFLLGFSDGTYLTVTVQMWGCIQLTERGQPPGIYYLEKDLPSPLADSFTPQYFDSLFAVLEPEDKRSIKFFLISKPGIQGLGNGYTQDVCYRARLHPRHLARTLNDAQKQSLYEALRFTLSEAVMLGGRDTELDLYGRPGRYTAILSAKTAGSPCPNCGTTIRKESFLGGAIYFCPVCQE